MALYISSLLRTGLQCRLAHMAHKTVVVPSIVIVPIAAFSTDNAIRIVGENIRLRPWRRRWRSISGHHALHLIVIIIIIRRLFLLSLNICFLLPVKSLELLWLLPSSTPGCFPLFSFLFCDDTLFIFKDVFVSSPQVTLDEATEPWGVKVERLEV